MTKPRPQYRSPLEGETGWIERVLAVQAWIRQHARALSIGVAGFVLLAAVTLYYLDYRSDVEGSASVQLARARETVQSGNTTLAITDLQRFLAQYGSTRAAREARVMLGTLFIQTGRPQEALDAIADLAAKPGEGPVAARAALVAGAAYQAKGDSTAAIQHYLRIADGLRMDYQRRDALASAARLQTLTGDFRGAAATYSRLVQLAPEESVERPLYEMRLAEVQARARAAEASADGRGSP